MFCLQLIVTEKTVSSKWTLSELENGKLWIQTTLTGILVNITTRKLKHSVEEIDRVEDFAQKIVQILIVRLLVDEHIVQKNIK